MRITSKHLEAKVSIINGMLGFDTDTLEYNTVGSLQLYHAYGATGVHKVVSTSHAVESLMELGTAREASQFLSGMIAALRLTKGE